MFGLRAFRQRRSPRMIANPTWHRVEQLNDASKILAGTRQSLMKGRGDGSGAAVVKSRAADVRDCDSETPGRLSTLCSARRRDGGGRFGEFPKRIRANTSFGGSSRSRTPPISG